MSKVLKSQILGLPVLAIAVGVLILLSLGALYANQRSQASGSGDSTVYAVALILKDGKVIKQIDPKDLSIIDVGGSTIYNSQDGSTSDLGAEFKADIITGAVQPKSWTITGVTSLFVDGAKKLDKTFSKSGTGVPPKALSLDILSRSGSSLASDFGASGLTATTHSIRFDIVGSVKVDFVEGQPITTTFVKEGIISIPVEYKPTQGTVSVNLYGTTSSGTTFTATQTGTATATSTFVQSGVCSVVSTETTIEFHTNYVPTKVFLSTAKLAADRGGVVPSTYVGSGVVCLRANTNYYGTTGWTIELTDDAVTQTIAQRTGVTLPPAGQSIRIDLP